MGQACCTQGLVANTTADRNGEISIFNHHHTDLDNVIINRLRSAEVVLLLRLFNSQCVNDTSYCKKILHEDGFVRLFATRPPMNVEVSGNSRSNSSNGDHDLSSYHERTHLYSRLFRAYDRWSRGCIDFREFCFGCAICSYGSKLEKVSFLISMFSTTPTTSGKSGKSNSSFPIVKQADSSGLTNEAPTSASVADNDGDGESSTDIRTTIETLTNDNYIRLMRLCGVDTPSAQHTANSMTNKLPLQVSADYLSSSEAASLVGSGGLAIAFAKLVLLPGKQQETRSVLNSVMTNMNVVDEDSAINMDEHAGVTSLVNQYTHTEIVSPVVSSTDSGSHLVKPDIVSTAPHTPNCPPTSAFPPEMSYTYMLDEVVYIVDSDWWYKWCIYAMVVPFYDASGTVLVSLNECMPMMNSVKSSNNTPTSGSNSAMNIQKQQKQVRPNGIDNGALLDANVVSTMTDDSSYFLKPYADLQVYLGGDCEFSSDSGSVVPSQIPMPSAAYVCIPSDTWQILFKLYGGSGPVLYRKISSIQYNTPDNSDTRNSCVTITVDMYPTVVSGYWCNVLGHVDDNFQQPMYIPSTIPQHLTHHDHDGDSESSMGDSEDATVCTIDQLICMLVNSYYNVHLSLKSASTKAGIDLGSSTDAGMKAEMGSDENQSDSDGSTGR